MKSALILVVIAGISFATSGCAREEERFDLLSMDMADDFDPSRGRWLYALEQHEAKVKQRLLRRARSLSGRDPQKADFLVTVINQFGSYCKDDERLRLARQAADILSGCLPDCPPKAVDRGREHLSSFEMHLSERNFDQSFNDLVFLSAVVNGNDCLAFNVRPAHGRQRLESEQIAAYQDLCLALESALKQLELENNRKEAVRQYSRLGACHFRLGDIEKSRLAFEKALSEIEQTHPDEASLALDEDNVALGPYCLRARAHLHLGNVFIELADYRTAMQRFRDGLRTNHLGRDNAGDVILTNLEFDQGELVLGLKAATRLARHP